MSRTRAARALLACVVLMATDAFTLVPLASRSPIIARSMPFPPVLMAADADDKAAAVKAAKAAKAKTAKAKAAKAPEAADAVDEPEETPEEKAAREAAITVRKAEQQRIRLQQAAKREAAAAQGATCH